MAWDLNWKDSTSHASRKLKFSKTNFLLLLGQAGTKDTEGLSALQAHQTQPTFFTGISGDKSYIGDRALIQILPAAKADFSKKKYFLSLPFLTNNQSKLIPMPARHFGVPNLFPYKVK